MSGGRRLVICSVDVLIREGIAFDFDSTKSFPPLDGCVKLQHQVWLGTRFVWENILGSILQLECGLPKPASTFRKEGATHMQNRISDGVTIHINHIRCRV